MFIYVFYFNTARDVVTVLFIFAECLSLYLHTFTCTYRGTQTKAHTYNQHTRAMATTRHRSLAERGQRKVFVRDKGLAHMHKRNGGKGRKRRKRRGKSVRKNRYSLIEMNAFKHIELPAKLLDFFLRK